MKRNGMDVKLIDHSHPFAFDDVTEMKGHFLSTLVHSVSVCYLSLFLSLKNILSQDLHSIMYLSC